jgi:hypothetical protein
MVSQGKRSPQSMSNSPKGVVLGSPSRRLIRSVRSKSGSIRTKEKLGESRRLRREQSYQNQARDHAADESDRPDKLLQQSLISVNALRRGLEWPVLAGVHRAAQLNFGTMYQARKARMARTMITIAVYLIAAYPARLDDSGSGLWV